MKRPGLMLFLLTTALLGASCRPDANTPAEMTQKLDADAAKAYVEAGCWRCHSVSTLEAELKERFGTHASGARPTGPDLAGIGMLYPDGWHTAHLWAPAITVGGSQMPAQRDLFEADASLPTLTSQGQLVVRFMQSLTAPSSLRGQAPEGPFVYDGKGTAARGAVLFRHFCAGCHGADATGGGPAARFLAIKPLDLTVSAGAHDADYLLATITTGRYGTGMPSFAAVCTEAERSDLTAFLLGLKKGGGG